MLRATPSLPMPVARVLRLLGADIRAARTRRLLRSGIVAERARISHPTLTKVERGDPAVSLGIYATVSWVLGLLGPLERLAAPATDATGLTLEEERLPIRVRTRHRDAPGT